MKNLMTWVKANVVVVVFLAVILVVLPASYVVSAAWGASIRKEQADKAGKEFQRVSGAKLDYALPSADPAIPAVVHKAEPNSRLTEWFKAKRDELESQAGAIVKRAVEFNRGIGPDAQSVFRREHRVLVEGLFGDAALEGIAAEVRQKIGADAWTAMTPEDRVKAVKDRARELEQAKLYEMEDKLLAKAGNPDPYQRLLDGIRAGDRADAIRLAQTLMDMKTRETEKVTAGKRDLTKEESATLAKALVERRLGEYQGRARELSVYASLSAFPRDARDPDSVTVPRGTSLQPNELNPAYLFIYQWDYWVFSDLLSAVRLANTGADGRPTNVDRSVVKRIVSMKLTLPEGVFSQPSSSESGLAPPPDPTATVAGYVPTDPQLSITGRGMGSWNKMYDIRRATMSVIVSSERLGEFLDAVERSNFMTVTDLDLDEVDPWSELRDGYYYGSEHVVKATVGIETVWLRDWTARLYPDSLKSLLKFPESTTPPYWAANAPASSPQ
ncbi:hypothetical protein PHYC_00360 [Phycisphaerales bacterium]|nr:hypothetical protein PHYC_00360 [Phycisphaerales bacterium]